MSLKWLVVYNYLYYHSCLAVYPQGADSPEHLHVLRGCTRRKVPALCHVCN